MSFKICTIGCGAIADSVHGPSYVKYKSNYPDTILRACCDIDEARSKIFQKKFGFERCYTDYVEMLEIEKPDAVCVISPDILTWK